MREYCLHDIEVAVCCKFAHHLDHVIVKFVLCKVYFEEEWRYLIQQIVDALGDDELVIPRG